MHFLKLHFKMEPASQLAFDWIGKLATKVLWNSYQSTFCDVLNEKMLLSEEYNYDDHRENTLQFNTVVCINEYLSFFKIILANVKLTSTILYSHIGSNE
nr:hypothetical transcript [Hymenolepis microstoma]